MNLAFWTGKVVLITGHTGFKGSWLSLLLGEAGARVVGYGLDPPTHPSLFESAAISRFVTDVRGDIRHTDHLVEVLREHRPDVVFHMAAQSVVKQAYTDPVETYSTNVMGTVSLFEALRSAGLSVTVVDITSDKCYANDASGRPFRETDPLGGDDPYSASKACAEIVHASYAASYFRPDRVSVHGVRLASARAGNVVGGGDWTAHQLVPDAVRAFSSGKAIRLRYPDATRPWQHVLDCLHGYVVLAEHLAVDAAKYGGAWNFGPSDLRSHSVAEVVDALARRWGPTATWERDVGVHPHEAPALALDSSKSRALLRWEPVLHFEEAINWIAEWYLGARAGDDTRSLTQRQIAAFVPRVTMTTR